MKRYKCVADYQTGDWCVGLVNTATGWLKRMRDWLIYDGVERPDIIKEVRFWQSKIRNGEEEELIGYIADKWGLEIKEVKE